MNGIELTTLCEDTMAIVISQSTAQKMGHWEVKIIEVSLNTNDIFVNLYGNKNYYKAFPDIGEDCENGLCCASRRINYSTAPITLSDTMNLLEEDTKYRGKGKIIDIQVISNIDNPEEVLNYKYNKQIKHYYDEQQNYYNNFIKYAEPIVTDRNNKVSKDFVDLYNYYSRLVDPNNKFLVDDNLFDHLRLKFLILEKHPLVVGSKLAGRYGDKGVVSEILPDSEMPTILEFSNIKPAEDSIINLTLDAILNPLGIPNRLNPSQSIEMEINYCSKFIRYNMEQNWEKWSLEEEKEYLLNYIKVIGEEDYNYYNDFMNTLSDSDLEDLLIELITNGIPIHQPPINGAKNIIDLARIYKYTGVKRSKFKNIECSIVFGEKFMMTLKHIPDSKFSARSVDQLSIQNIPVKTNLYKMYKQDYSTNAIKIGERLPM